LENNKGIVYTLDIYLYIFSARRIALCKVKMQQMC